MSQLGLFESGPLQLLEDRQGGIRYQPGFVDAAEAWAWFEWLRAHVAWGHERRLMYEREVDVPRLVARYALDDAALPPLLATAADRVSAALAVPFSSVGLNYYRDAADSVAPHNDHLDELVPGFPIALVSLGHTRRMDIRAKPPAKQAFHLALEPGSLLVMSYESQRHYLHGIPKQKAVAGARISLAFRVRPPERP